MAKVSIVKRSGDREPFDEKQLYASAFFAARNCHMTESDSKKVAKAAVTQLKKKLKGKKEVSSQDIFDWMKDILYKIDYHVAFMYETHRDLS